MQDRYAADIGDFSKFQLLRALNRMSAARVGVSWYLFPDESHNADGRHLGYLDRPDYTTTEPELTRALKTVSQDVRSVAALQTAGILPQDTLYFADPIPRSGGPGRATWFQNSLRALSGSQIVFADPDNGLLASSVHPGSSKYGKYITVDEISGLLTIAPLVVVYHHFGRNGTHAEQAENVLERCMRCMPESQAVGLRFSRYSPRLYVLIARRDAEALMAVEAANQLSRDHGDKWQLTGRSLTVGAP